jgi:hypothetical protein
MILCLFAVIVGAPLSRAEAKAPPAAAAAEPAAAEPAAAPPAPAAAPAEQAASDSAEEDTAQAAAPRQAEVLVALTRLTKFELATGTYTAEFELLIKCNEAPCNPTPVATNGKFTSIEVQELDPLIKFFTVKAELYVEIDLSEFPFDRHTLPLSIQDKKEAYEYVYAQDFADVIKDKMGIKSFIAPDVKLPGWAVGATLEPRLVTKKFGKMEEKRLSFEVSIKRPLLASFFKTLMPVFFMLFVAGFMLLIKPKGASGRLAAATGGLMTVVMFHLAATSSLPPLGYLTRMDKFMLATYIVYLANILFAVGIVRFDEAKQEKRAEMAYLIAGGAVPGIALLAWLTVFLKIA